MHLPSSSSLYSSPTKSLFAMFLKARALSVTTQNPPDLFSLLHHSPNAKHLRHLHAHLLRTFLYSNVVLSSKLVLAYSKLNHLFPTSLSVFWHMPYRNIFSWNIIIAMFGGYVQQGEAMLGLAMFREMGYSGFALDSVVMVSLLMACGQLGALKHGKSVHGWCIRRCSCLGLNLGNAITDMYVKCSILDYAHTVFVNMSRRDVISWSSLILGYGLDGDVVMSFKLFDEMLKEGIEPNAVTFLGVLSACAHGGLVEKSWLYFRLMQEYNIVPELKHYASVADCMSRAGLLEEAEKFLEDMPVKPDEAVMGAVLSGCKVYGNVEVGERVARELIQLKPRKASYYVTLAGLYSAAGRFDEAESLRQWMKEKQISKVPGCSSI
ncbi:Pentatricopeptide repeat (PPR) superfamily protein [Arabidopsis thaliana]|uniref:Pentatricopeptide repeat (PPR) superfamily protein n=1 Tax=Arabidopsis thaliana TaxID=3702 RepID=A0A1P8B6L5_ARATH|nr:Pentatricopeptide repeat (PPR) superfamily protein [Arabidopsis thaliana]ANM67232.1 Pentatricopeptide repeat (PPR) superfamily protein [Arabidopsis thaliana]|eukprot:NP_001329074.1 Pentatricopeptide repeat (PPR) superfamily protein [Arabidopsis thaliana]